MREQLIEVKNLKKNFASGIFRKNYVKAVDGISFDIARGETMALVGESGCGKSTVGRCVLNLIKPTSGKIYFKGEDISNAIKRKKNFRKKMQMIFQDADGSLNPRMKIYDLMLEPLIVHKLANKEGPFGKTKEKLLHIMQIVNLTPDILDRYPNELSGGQRQRVGIARAIASNPEFIVADEPAASLDLSVQAGMLELMKRLQEELGIAYLYISHNLRVVKIVADRVAVMYLGRLVEMGNAEEIFQSPAHPYTRALLSAVPNADPTTRRARTILKGEIPNFSVPPSGCGFYTRCPEVKPLCTREIPLKRRIGKGHLVWCHYALH